MCGIAGIISRDPERVRAALPRLSAALVHRGPDDAGSEVLPLGDATLGLAFRRLAIQDLSEAGHQPMHHPDSDDVILFNGEIYNVNGLREQLAARGHVFRGHSDTEVVLHMLTEDGPEILPRLAGMFATAFYDRRRQRLLLARDPMGIKPIYVARTPDAWCFASEVRALLAAGGAGFEIDPAAIATFLAYGSIAEPLTIYKNVRSFPAGSWCWFDGRILEDANGAAPRRYWDIPEARTDVDETRVETNVRELLETSVREHLISDVPVGVFLSAGFDSTIVAALAARHTSKLRTFTVGFADHADLSEAELAAETARRIGATHTSIEVLGEDAEGALVPWLAALDQPSIDGLNTYIISQAVRRQGIIVALSGLGGDELFAGYDTFQRLPHLRRAFRRIGWLPGWGRAALASVATIGKPPAVAHKAGDIARGSGSVLELYLQMRRTMSERQLAALGLQAEDLGLTRTFLPAAAVENCPIAEHDPIWSVSALEARLYMTNTLLRDSDVNGMAHSLEIRVPFLDRRVMDYVFGLPGAVRRPPGAPAKHLLRHCFPDILRTELLEKPKSGFTLPVGRWMLGPLRDFCEASLARLKSMNILRAAGVDEVWNAFVSGGDTTRWSRAFSLCLLGAYFQDRRAA